jgi:hypothetical protein
MHIFSVHLSAALHCFALRSATYLIHRGPTLYAGIEEEPEEEKKPQTAKGIAQLLKQKEERKEETAIATYLNCGVNDPNTVEKVLVKNWERTKNNSNIFSWSGSWG